MANLIMFLERLLVGGFFVAGGMLKWPSEFAMQRVGETVLGRLNRSKMRLAIIVRTIAVVEVGLGVTLIVAGRALVVVILALGALAIAAGYVVLVGRGIPHSGCGCLGSASTGTSWRDSLPRAILLALPLALCAMLRSSGQGRLLENPLLFIGLVLQIALIAKFSPERRAAVHLAQRSQHRLRSVFVGSDCRRTRSGGRRAMRRIGTSPLWARVSELRTQVIGDAVDEWQDGCWQVASFSATHDGQPVTVIFGVSLQPGANTHAVAVLDQAEAIVFREAVDLSGLPVAGERHFSLIAPDAVPLSRDEESRIAAFLGAPA